MKKHNDFIENLNILDGIITYNSFDIDETVPFQEKWYSYNEDILQIKFGDRITLDVGWYPEGDPKGKFMVKAVLDDDWLNPISKIKCRNLSELKRAIEKTALLINEKRK